MITSEKVSIFKKYKGYYDGYYVQNEGKTITISDDEWFLLDNFMQDILMIRKGICSNSYKKQIIEKINANCDNKETYNLIFEVEKYLSE